MSKKRDLELFLVDIFIAIVKIKEYTKSFHDEEAFRYSSLHWDATIRQLEIIGESLNNLLDDDTFEKLSPKYFRKIVNFRNVIVHGYFGIDASEVWNIITEKLDLLESDLKKIIENNIDLSQAIESEIQEYKSVNDLVVVNFLKKFV